MMSNINNIKILSEFQPRSQMGRAKQMSNKVHGKVSSVEPRPRYEKHSIQSRNPNPSQQSANKNSNMGDYTENTKNSSSKGLILELDSGSKILQNRKVAIESATSLSSGKKNQNKQFISTKTPELGNRQKVEGISNTKQPSKQPISQPQSVRATLDNNHLLFSKNVAAFDRGKGGRPDLKTPSDKKESGSFKISSNISSKKGTYYTASHN